MTNTTMAAMRWVSDQPSYRSTRYALSALSMAACEYLKNRAALTPATRSMTKPMVNSSQLPRRAAQTKLPKSAAGFTWRCGRDAFWIFRNTSA